MRSSLIAYNIKHDDSLFKDMGNLKEPKTRNADQLQDDIKIRDQDMGLN